ncbi:MAG: SPASM domain-containing protein [Propionibacteriaceae bacterium]|nr:SPASM domain-containing protein [Propionibacteriaceae bacterium]
MRRSRAPTSEARSRSRHGRCREVPCPGPGAGPVPPNPGTPTPTAWSGGSSAHAPCRTRYARYRLTTCRCPARRRQHGGCCANQGWSERPGGHRLLYTQTGSLVTERSVGGAQYGRFLVDVYEEWIRRDVGTVFVQLFDVTLQAYFGQYSLCIHAPTCGTALALEHNGDLYSCDHYVEPDYLLGNINQTHMLDLVASPRQRAFGQNKRDSLTGQCRSCDVLALCNGGCPKDRFVDSRDGEPGQNYLCEALYDFYTHTRPTMIQMARLIQQGRYADEVMTRIAHDAGDADAP